MQAKDEWPRAPSGGLGMEMVDKLPDGSIEYRLVHNSSYQDVQRQFDMCVESMDPQRLIHLLQYNPYHLSTLLHQTLALIVQSGGLSASATWAQLCGRGPFRTVSREMYVGLLRCMHAARPPLIEQSPDGQLMLGPGGERLTASYEFYAVFATTEE